MGTTFPEARLNRESPLSFTLADALFDLGHRCPGTCPAEVDSIDEIACVVRRGTTVGSVGLVVVDLWRRDESANFWIHVLREINDCVRGDRIRVLVGQSAEPALPPVIDLRDDDHTNRRWDSSPPRDLHYASSTSSG